MKRKFGVFALCACLLFPARASAREMEAMELEGEIDVPGISEEVDALIGDVGQSESTEEFYRLLKKDAALSAYGADIAESAYDPRKEGKVTPVRAQKSSTCWAFATLAAAEQSLVQKGLSDPAALDLSEAHLSYFFYHPVTDPLGNTKGDGNHNISAQNYIDVGSNTIFSTFALANWVGAAKEETAPFDTLTEDAAYDAVLAYADAAHLKNAYWINFKDVDAVNVVKQMIRSYGAAAINFYWNSRYYNADSFAYYFPLDSSQANNHSVAIVGWDDAYPKENFNESCRPMQDGAWIVKNSNGESFGDGGFFYLSYEDSAVNSGNTSANRARAYVFDFEAADNYDCNYQYDGSAGAYNVTHSDSPLTLVDSGGSIANVFRVHNSDASRIEKLKAVSFALFDTAVSYRIQIYKNLKDASDPTSGTAQLVRPTEGSTSYAGYYTVPLNAPVDLEKNETFSVVVTLKKESGGAVNFFVDKTYQNGDWISFTNEVEAGQSFRTMDGAWQDMALNGATARVKAFTKLEDAPLVARKEKKGTLSVKEASASPSKQEQVDASGTQERGSVTPASPAKPTKSANTEDASGKEAFFWASSLIALLVILEIKKRRGRL